MKYCKLTQVLNLAPFYIPKFHTCIQPISGESKISGMGVVGGGGHR